MTGREALKRIAGNEWIADELGKMGFFCVPLEPTKEMIDAAWADALAEDATGVWQSMIDACRTSDVEIQDLRV